MLCVGFCSAQNICSLAKKADYKGQQVRSLPAAVICGAILPRRHAAEAGLLKTRTSHWLDRPNVSWKLPASTRCDQKYVARRTPQPPEKQEVSMFCGSELTLCSKARLWGSAASLLSVPEARKGD